MLAAPATALKVYTGAQASREPHMQAPVHVRRLAVPLLRVHRCINAAVTIPNMITKTRAQIVAALQARASLCINAPVIIRNITVKMIAQTVAERRLHAWQVS